MSDRPHEPPGVHRFELGRFTCFALRDGGRTMEMAQLFPRVPPAELRAALAASGADPEIPVGYSCLLIDSGEGRVLIDTGGGSGELLDNLASAGYAPDDIDRVVITHGDGDHIGGIGSFGRARFVMTPLAWELWTGEVERRRMVDEFVELFRGSRSPAELAATAEQRERYGREVLPALAERVELVEPEVEFAPGMRLVAAPGHRSDHTAVEIESEGELLLHVVDGIRHALQATHPGWTSYIDSYPEQVAQTNRRLLARAAEREALVFGAHLPFPALGRVRSAPAAGDSGFVWDDP